MAGILNDKQRIMDVLLTLNGRRQISDGTFKIEFASFSDHGVFYRAGDGGVADDAGSRIMFEAYSSPSDTVIPEINSEGAISMDIFSGNNLANGKIVTTDTDSSGNPKPRFVSGSIDVYSSSADIIQNSIKSFDNLQIIGTQNNWSDQDFFSVSKNSITFQKPEDTPDKEKYLDAMSPVFTYDSLASLPAFRYLPPIYKDSQSELKLPMAAYRKMNVYPKLDFSMLINSLEAESIGKDVIEFKSDDPYLNIVSQVFEINGESVGKLAIVDYGTYVNEEGAEIGSVYHLGKIFRDSSNIPKFVKVLSIVFE